ncbi:MAG TPA: hypothetical protein VD969_19015 [Symbiobacteriaceae bacterium]|nr:hypothetical protein [Symbiobacteriaceae bacterium]
MDWDSCCKKDHRRCDCDHRRRRAVSIQCRDGFCFEVDRHDCDRKFRHDFDKFDRRDHRDRHDCRFW